MPPGGVMEFLVLGPLEVRGSALPLGPPSGKQGGLLALLALHANQVLATDRLIHALWGEQPPPSARQALQNHVSAVRKLLADGGGEAVLRTRDPGYVLAVDPEDRKSTRLNSSHVKISYAVFCLKKNTEHQWRIWRSCANSMSPVDSPMTLSE